MNQNNISLERVIKGLECCQKCDGYICRNCCPYHDRNEPEGQPTCTCHLAGDTLSLLKSLSAFKSYFDSLYGENLEIANWHLNGMTESFDSFYDSAMEEYENA